MPSRNRFKTGWTALLPATTFWRFFLATAVLAFLTASGAMLASTWIGKKMVYEIQEETGYTLLRSAADLIGRSRIADENMRSLYLANRKTHLKDLNKYALEIMESYEARIRAGELAPAAAKNEAFRQLNWIAANNGLPFYVFDRDFMILVHSNDYLRGSSLRNFQDNAGNYTFRQLAEDVREAGSGQTVFTMYPWRNKKKFLREHRLAAATYYGPWNLTIGAGMFLSDADDNLVQARLDNLNELRARIREITIAKTGYIFFFDEDCETLGHPTMTGKNFEELHIPGSGESICRKLQKVAELPWGKNKLRYQWEKPDDRDNPEHDKIAWCTREPVTGWYVCASSYVREMENTLPTFIMSIFLPSLGSILLLGGALALLLRNLLKPIKELTDVCQAVSQGDLSVSASIDAPGEMGFLCRRFNAMVGRLRGLRRKEARRQEELQELNKSLEKMVDVRTRALKRKAVTLEQANIRLQELDKMKSGFLSSVSHELRTPLTSILGFAKLINRDFKKSFHTLSESDPKLMKKSLRISENLDIIRHEGERLTRLINDVLDLNKIESGRTDWNDEEIQIAEIINHAQLAVSGQYAQNPDMKLMVEVAEGLPPLTLDKDRLLQVFINILNNAAKFTERGVITLRAYKASDDYVGFSVSDPGIGIPEKDHASIFDKFHQVSGKDTIAQKPQGTGLGLAICKQIIEHYNGRIWVESEPGKGSTFIFELPVWMSDAQKPDDSSKLLTDAHLDDLDLEDDKPLIMVVDDDPSVNSYLSQFLEGEGYAVISAFNGVDALRLAKEMKPALITMDIMMPVMDGKTAIGLLREDSTLAGIPILIVSVLQDTEPMGGDASLTKPINQGKLLDTVRSLLSLSDSEQPIIALRRNGKEDLGAFFALCPSCISHCTEQELWGRIEQGFEGTVILPAWAVDTVNLEKLSDTPGVQVLIMPEREKTPTSGS